MCQVLRMKQNTEYIVSAVQNTAIFMEWPEGLTYECGI